MSPDLARTKKVSCASTAYRGMIGIDSHVPTIMPTTVTLWMNAGSHGNLYIFRVFGLHHACLGGDHYQTKIVSQRIEKQEVFTTGANFYRCRER
jgi:hypothetical protein